MCVRNLLATFFVLAIGLSHSSAQEPPEGGGDVHVTRDSGSIPTILFKWIWGDAIQKAVGDGWDKGMAYWKAHPEDTAIMTRYAGIVCGYHKTIDDPTPLDQEYRRITAWMTVAMAGYQDIVFTDCEMTFRKPGSAFHEPFVEGTENEAIVPVPAGLVSNLGVAADYGLLTKSGRDYYTDWTFAWKRSEVPGQDQCVFRSHFVALRRNPAGHDKPEARLVAGALVIESRLKEGAWVTTSAVLLVGDTVAVMPVDAQVPGKE